MEGGDGFAAGDEMAAWGSEVDVRVAGAFQDALNRDGATVNGGAESGGGICRKRPIGLPKSWREIAAMEDPFVKRVTKAAALVIEERDDVPRTIGRGASDEHVFRPGIAVKDVRRGEEVQGHSAFFNFSEPAVRFFLWEMEPGEVVQQPADGSKDKVAPARVRTFGMRPPEVRGGRGVDTLQQGGQFAPERVVLGRCEGGHCGVPVVAFDEFAKHGIARADLVREIRANDARKKRSDIGEPRGERVFPAQEVVLNMEDQRMRRRRRNAQDPAAFIVGGKNKRIVECTAAHFPGFGNFDGRSEEARGKRGDVRGRRRLLKVARATRQRFVKHRRSRGERPWSFHH